MSLVRVVHLACDHTDCDRMFLDADGAAAEVRREARRVGWTTGPGGKDYCPEHPDHPTTDQEAS